MQLKDDKRLDGYNMERVFANFTAWCLKQASAYKSNHILIPMGEWVT